MINEYNASDLAIIELQEFFNEYVSYSNLNLSYDLFGDIIGGVNLNICAPEADIVFLFVRERYRGNKYSISMMNEVFDKLRTLDIKKVYLEVDTSNCAALALYNKLGFKEINRRKAYYENGDDAIVMEIEL